MTSTVEQLNPTRVDISVELPATGPQRACEELAK